MDVDVTFRSEGRFTQAQFFDWLRQRPPADVHHYELIHGRIVMAPPADLLHAGAGARVSRYLGGHVESRGLGRVFDSSAGYDLPSGDTLEPDVSFVSNERLAAATPLPRGRFARVVPDLVVEVLSRSTARRDRTVKKEIYAANGVRELWLVDPERRAVTVFADGGRLDRGRTFTEGPIDSPLLPGLELAVEAIFD